MTRAICTSEHVVSPADLIGHLNLMHPERVQVIGTPEIAWSARQTPEKLAHHMQDHTDIAAMRDIDAEDATQCE